MKPLVECPPTASCVCILVYHSCVIRLVSPPVLVRGAVLDPVDETTFHASTCEQIFSHLLMLRVWH